MTEAIVGVALTVAVLAYVLHPLLPLLRIKRTDS
jgi:uncharacterized MnhB-related membrane protein